MWLFDAFLGRMFFLMLFDVFFGKPVVFFLFFVFSLFFSDNLFDPFPGGSLHPGLRDRLWRSPVPVPSTADFVCCPLKDVLKPGPFGDVVLEVAAMFFCYIKIMIWILMSVVFLNVFFFHFFWNDLWDMFLSPQFVSCFVCCFFLLYYTIARLNPEKWRLYLVTKKITDVMLITRFYILGLFDIYHACPSQTCFPISSRHCRFWHKSKAGDPWDMCLVLEWEQLKKCCSKNSCATCFVTWFESTPTQENKWAHLTQGLKLIWVHPQSISNCQKWSLENSKGCGFGRNPPSKSARLPYEIFLHLNREGNWIESPAWSLGLQKQLQELMVQVMPFWHQREAF